MRLPDAQAILGIDTNASRDEAQRAYRRQALCHHPDRSSDPDATSKFQTIGEAWERVQRYHDNPNRWGVHSDPPEDANEDSKAEFDRSSWEDLFSRWFGGGGGARSTAWSQTDFSPPRRHEASCQCASCTAERRREEIFAQRAVEREARRRARQQILDEARRRATNEAARTAERVQHDAAMSAARAAKAAREHGARRERAAAALEDAVTSLATLDEEAASLEQLLDAFSVLRTAIKSGQRAGLAAGLAAGPEAGLAGDPAVSASAPSAALCVAAPSLRARNLTLRGLRGNKVFSSRERSPVVVAQNWPGDLCDPS